MHNHLLIVTDNQEEYVKLVQDQRLSGLTLQGVDDATQARSLAPFANIILGEPAMVVPLLEPAVRLEWLQSTFAGVDQLCRDDLRRDYLLTGVKETFGPLMSEYVLGYILAVERHLFELRQSQHERRWHPLPYRGLRGLVLGICGFGSIGRHLARAAKAFSLRTLAYKRTPGSSPLVERVYTGDELGEFLSALDYLVITLPDTPQTRGLIDRNALAFMKRGALLINVGRGKVIVESDLEQALVESRISGAVLDVFEAEPLPAESRLWDLPNCFITPHISAVSFPEDIVRLFSDNYRRFIAGRRLAHVIDFESGY